MIEDRRTGNSSTIFEEVPARMLMVANIALTEESIDQWPPHGE